MNVAIQFHEVENENSFYLLFDNKNNFEEFIRSIHLQRKGGEIQTIADRILVNMRQETKCRVILQDYKTIESILEKRLTEKQIGQIFMYFQIFNDAAALFSFIK